MAKKAVAKKTKEIDPNAPVVRVPRMAQLLSCSPRAAERLLKTGVIKSFRVGRMRLVRRETIEQFARSRESEAS